MTMKKKNFWDFYDRLQEVLNSSDSGWVIYGQRALEELEKGDVDEAFRLLDLNPEDF